MYEIHRPEDVCTEGRPDRDLWRPKPQPNPKMLQSPRELTVSDCVPRWHKADSGISLTSDQSPPAMHATVPNQACASVTEVIVQDDPLPPVHSLPVELVTSIFIVYAKDTEHVDASDYFYAGESPGKKEKERFSMHWVGLMLVCRRWRNIGLCTPRLWCYIHVTANSDALRFRLAKSHPSLIDVFFTPAALSNATAMEMLLAEASRIRSISHSEYIPQPLLMHLKNPEHARMLRFIKPLFSHPLPALEDIVIFPYSVGDDEHVVDRHFDLGLTVELHPRIRTFAICSIRLPSPSSWRYLRVLKLKMFTAVHLIEDLVCIFSNAPDLEVMVLIGVFVNSAVDYPMRTPKRTPLSRLRKVALMGPAAFVGAVLQRIRCPALVLLHVDTHVADKAIVRRFFPTMLLPIARRLISTLHRLYLQMVSWKTTISSSPIGYNVARFTLDVCHPAPADSNASEPAVDVLCHVLSGAPLRHIELVNYIYPIPLDAWTRLLTIFTSLRKIVLHKTTLAIVHSLLDALATPVNGRLLPPQPCTLFIEQPLDMHNTLHSHDLLQHLLNVITSRVDECADCALSVVLDIVHPVGRTGTILNFKMHRWLLYAIARKSGSQLDFADWANKMGFGQLYDYEESRWLAAGIEATGSSSITDSAVE